MKDGFTRVAAVTPKIKVADVDYNSDVICAYMERIAREKIKVAVFPELCLTGYSCQDLFLQDSLLEAAEKALLKIAEVSEKIDGLFFIGLPFAVDGKLRRRGCV